ncbi:14579_t:CDS:2, partial [Ambispora leptoticha]
METGYPPNRGATLNRGKTLSRPERYQPAVPLLTAKESSSWDPWVVFSRVVTFWAPGSLLSSLGGLHDKGSQQAWREKIALCFIAIVMGGIVAFLTVGFSSVLCPPSAANNPTKFLRYNSTDASGKLGILGWQFDISQSKTAPNVDFYALSAQLTGQDITNRFARDYSKNPACQGKDIQQFAAVTMQLCQNKTICNAGPLSDQTFQAYNIKNTTKLVGYDWKQLASDPLKNYLVIDGNVLNLDPYIAATPVLPNDKVDVVIRTVLGTDHKEGGKDATRLFFGRPELKASVNCLLQKYFAGNIDKATIGCFTSQLFLYVSLTVILSIVMVRFFMACVFNWFISPRLALPPKKSSKAVVSPQVVVGGSGGGARAAPWAHRNESGAVVKTISMDDVGNDLFTVLLVTCYSEGEEGLRCTCESMAATDYPDDRKLLFLVCDGIITGHGNDKSTPDIAVDLLELVPEFKDPQPQSYVAVAAGSKQHNMAKVYAGYYPYKDGRKIPVVCVVKCGGPAEQGKPKPGNRGKRDSQLILMNFFSRVTYNDRMTALDYDLFRKIHHLMGVTPDFFEICLMVDADTKVYPDSLRLLIN